MSNQLCYVFRESNPIIRHKEKSHNLLHIGGILLLPNQELLQLEQPPVGFRVYGLGFRVYGNHHKRRRVAMHSSGYLGPH